MSKTLKEWGIRNHEDITKKIVNEDGKTLFIEYDQKYFKVNLRSFIMDNLNAQARFVLAEEVM